MPISKNVFIKRAKHLGDYRIHFEFTDGRTTEVDFHPFLSKPGQNPMAAQFLDIIRFKKFKLDSRVDIYWNDWEMCFPFAALYTGDLGVDPLGNKKRVSTRPLRLGAVQTKPAAARRKRPVKGVSAR